MTELTTSLQACLSEDDYTKFSQRNYAFLLKFRTDLEEVKCRKWHRDIQDYQLDRVYNWNQSKPTNTYKGFPRGDAFNFDNNDSEVFF